MSGPRRYRADAQTRLERPLRACILAFPRPDPALTNDEMIAALAAAIVAAKVAKRDKPKDDLPF